MSARLLLACCLLALAACGEREKPVPVPGPDPVPATVPLPEDPRPPTGDAPDPATPSADAPDGSDAWCGTGGAAGDGWMDEPGPWGERDREGVQTRVRTIGGGWPSVDETKRLEARKADLAKRLAEAGKAGAGDSVHAILMRSELEMIGRRLRGDSATWFEHRVEIGGQAYPSRPLENRRDFVARVRAEAAGR